MPESEPNDSYNDVYMIKAAVADSLSYSSALVEF
jgi:hypothetical protein